MIVRVADPVAPGTHLIARRGFYHHHGLWLGDDQVLHYSGPSGQKRDCTIRIDPFSQFARGCKVSIVPYRKGQEDHPQVVLQRAYERLGECRYSLMRNNCEHLVRYCKTGTGASGQVVAGFTILSLGLLIGAAIFSDR